jgi:hypothetical protein
MFNQFDLVIHHEGHWTRHVLRFWQVLPPKCLKILLELVADRYGGKIPPEDITSRTYNPITMVEELDKSFLDEVRLVFSCALFFFRALCSYCAVCICTVPIDCWLI